MSIRVLSAQHVRELLPMAVCIEALDAAMRTASGGGVKTPPRLIAPLIDGSGFFALMPGSMLLPACYGAKVVSLHPGNPAQGRPAIQGFVTLFDHVTGAPLTIMEGGEVTAIRTAAASGLATRELACKHAQTHGVFGTGVQARTHVAAVAAVRDINKVVIWGRDVSKAKALAQELELQYDCEFVSTQHASDAAACDVISVVTGAVEPVIFGRDVRAGTHVNLVGAHTPSTREADAALIAAGAVYVDSYESARNEAGDLLLAARENQFSMDDIRGEIGEVLSGSKLGRSSDEQITIYKSLGVVAQDLFAAELVYRRACEANVGTVTEL